MESWCYSGTGRKRTCSSGIADLGVLWWQEGITAGTRGRDSGWVLHAVPVSRSSPSFLLALPVAVLDPICCGKSRELGWVRGLTISCQQAQLNFPLEIWSEVSGPLADERIGMLPAWAATVPLPLPVLLGRRP